LAPWPNRLGDGRYEWGGRTYQAPLSEPERGNAIHGLVRWAPWALAATGERWAVLTHRLHPQPGWGWTLDLDVSYSLGDDGLTIRASATNRSDQPCPFGMGWHPYLRAFGGKVDQATLRAPAATVYVADQHGLPTARHPAEGTDLDFRAGRAIGSAVLDTAFGDLERIDDGRAVVELRSGPDGERWTRLWMDRAYTHLMLFSGDTLADPARRRDGLAVEPMTCAPNAFRSGDGLDTLAPDETTTATWGVQSGLD
jgi:aldose 1-epimerase